MSNYDHAKATLELHEDLWKRLSTDSRVDKSATLALSNPAQPMEPESLDGANDDESQRRILAFEALRLSEAMQRSLCVDDRVCQNAQLRARGDDSSAAFGTDCLVPALVEAGLITGSQAADAFLKLISWRYRFLIPSVEMWRWIVESGCRHDLVLVGRYMHDAVSDPGLFGGMEPEAEPPLPMAWKYFQECVGNLVQFVSGLWFDDAVDESRAAELTKVLIEQCLPGIPSCLAHNGDQLAGTVAEMVLQFALLQFLRMEDYSKANRALRQVSTGLGISDDEFVRLAEDIVDAIGESLSGDDDIRRQFQGRLMRHILVHCEGQIDGRTVQLMLKNGLFRDRPQDPMPPHVVEIIENPNDSRRNSSVGPIVLFRHNESFGAVSILHGLRTIDPRIRRAAFKEFSRYLEASPQPVEPATKRLFGSLGEESGKAGGDHHKQLFSRSAGRRLVFQCRGISAMRSVSDTRPFSRILHGSPAAPAIVSSVPFWSASPQPVAAGSRHQKAL